MDAGDVVDISRKSDGELTAEELVVVSAVGKSSKSEGAGVGWGGGCCCVDRSVESGEDAGFGLFVETFFVK